MVGKTKPKKEDPFRILVEQSGEGMLVVQEGRVVFANPRARDLLGLLAEEAPISQVLDRVDPSDRGKLRGLIESPYPARRVEVGLESKPRQKARLEIIRMEMEWQGQSAASFHLSGPNKTRPEDLPGTETEASGSAQEARLAAEAALKESEAKFRQIAEAVSQVIWLVDSRSQKVLYVNPAYERVWGRSCESLYRDFATWVEPIHPEDRERVISRLAAFVAVEEDVEFRILFPDGSVRWVRHRAFVVLDEAGKPRRVTGVSEDVTEIKEAEAEAEKQREKLIQADKMISLGTLVSGVAHEINNPVSLVIYNTPILERAWRDARPILDAHHRENKDFKPAGLDYPLIRERAPLLLRDIAAGAARIKDIVDGLKDFARHTPENITETFKINDVVAGAEVLLANAVKKNRGELVLDLGADLPPLTGRFQRIEQVVVNLVLNSCQALPDDGGRIVVSTRHEAEQGRLAITVRDDGSGMSAEVKKRIYDPFFTTKRAGGGMGLGLSIVERIVREHAGSIEIESQPGQGTRVAVYLPIRKNKDRG